MTPSEETRPVTDAARQAVKIGQLEIRMSSTERAVTDLTGEVKDQLKELNGKLGELVTKEGCTEQASQVTDNTKRWVTAALEAVERKQANKGGVLERMKNKAAAITVISSLVIAVVIGAYQVAKFAMSVEAMVKSSTAKVVQNATEVKRAVKRAPVKIYIPYDPHDTSSPPMHLRDLRHAP